VARGTVRFFNAVLGFGFIGPDDGGPDVVVPMSALDAAGLAGLNLGDDVLYDLQAGSRFGMQVAIDLKLVETPPPEVAQPLPARSSAS
jgi:CspA family cold shock protein